MTKAVGSLLRRILLHLLSQKEICVACHLGGEKKNKTNRFWL
jgi:hypothetical protein